MHSASNDSIRKEMLIARAAIQRIQIVHEVGDLRASFAQASGWRYWLSFAINNLSAIFLPPQSRTEQSTGGAQPIGSFEAILGVLEMIIPKRRPWLRAVLRGIRLWQLGSRLLEPLLGKRARSHRTREDTTPHGGNSQHASPAPTHAGPSAMM